MFWGKTAVAAVVAAGVLLLGACTGSATPVASSSGAADPAQPSAKPLRSPFTGQQVRSQGRVLAVKIDNTTLGRPQTGLTYADIIYVLPMEGGLSRYLAVFASHYPPTVGPVRSAREEDLPVLRQFGRPALAFSGAQPALLPVVEHARIVDLYSGKARGYYRSRSRFAPYNLYATTHILLSQASRASRARAIGFRFGPAPTGGRVTKSFTVAYPAATFRFQWSSRVKRWLVWTDGSPDRATQHGQLRPATVVIQRTTIRTSRFRERGARPPYAVTVGSGGAVVLRNGRAWNARWSRPNSNAGTAFTMASGQRMPFATGQVWVVYARK
jgi:hypothetical protein